MKPEEAKTEIRRAAIVTVEYRSSTNPLEPLIGKIVVPAHLLWSPDGMAAIFKKLRDDELGPQRRHRSAGMRDLLKFCLAIKEF